MSVLNITKNNFQEEVMNSNKKMEIIIIRDVRDKRF